MANAARASGSPSTLVKVTRSPLLPDCDWTPHRTIITPVNGRRAGKQFIDRRTGLTRGIRSGCSDNKAMKAMRRRIALSRSLGTLRAKSMPTRFRFCVSFRSAHAFSHRFGPSTHQLTILCKSSTESFLSTQDHMSYWTYVPRFRSNETLA